MVKQRVIHFVVVAAFGLWSQLGLAAKDVGTIDFATSTESAEAQAHFLRGATILHSFGWKQAISEFKKAQAADPDFAMAYWGESLCYNHPLIPEMDRQTPQDVLTRLGPTLDARLAKASTARELGFLLAVEALFFGEGDIKARRTAYMEVLRDLYEANPDDDEVAAFYALSLISAGGAAGKAGERKRVLAGSIAIQLFARNPDHPGGAHYTIHAFDDPVHAPLALPAARKFASIAAAVSHARHMPTHIFIQLGMWEQVSASNQSAYQAAVDLWEPGDSAGDMVHALDWGQYGDLQLGDYERGRMWVERMKKIAVQNSSQPRVAAVLPRVEARLIIETQQWQTQPVTDASAAPELLATGLSAVNLGDTTLAEQASRALARLAEQAAAEESFYNRRTAPLQIMQRQVAGAGLIASGSTEQGLALLEESVGIADQMPAPRGAANPIKPAHEFYGEALLAASRPVDAVQHFDVQLMRTPNRPLSLLGLARSYVALGDEDAAREEYRRLAEVWQNRDFPALREADVYLAGTQRP
jgi:tetratricopeptide (TPR) repeat protein